MPFDLGDGIGLTPKMSYTGRGLAKTAQNSYFLQDIFYFRLVGGIIELGVGVKSLVILVPRVAVLTGLLLPQLTDTATSIADS